MANTPRSKAAIMGLLPNNTTGLINPQIVRDAMETIFERLDFNPRDYGAIGDGTTNDTAAIQACHDAAEAAAGPGGYVIFTQATYKCNGTLVWNPRRVGLVGNASSLDFSSDTGTAIQFNERLADGFGHTKYEFSNISLQGPETTLPGTTSSIALDLNSPIAFNTSTSSRVNISGLYIQGFNTAVRVYNNAYMCHFRDTMVLNCRYGVYMPGDAVNAGENINWFGGSIVGCTCAVRLIGMLELHFFGTSFDYNYNTSAENSITTNIGIIVIDAGLVVLENCHVEMANPGSAYQIPYTVNLGALLYLNKTYTLLNGSNTPMLVPALFALTRSDSIAVVTECFFNNWSAPAWATGPGQLLMNKTQGFNMKGWPIEFNASHSLHDLLGGQGAFESTSVVGLQGGIVQGTGTTWTSKWVNNAVAVTVSTDRARTGTQSLKMVKAANGSSACQFLIMAPAVRHATHWMNGYALKPNAGGTNMVMQIFVSYLQLINYDTNGSPVWGASLNSETYSTTFAAGGSSTWVNISTNLNFGRVRCPDWATHWSLYFDFYGYDGALGGPVYLDDIRIFGA